MEIFTVSLFGHRTFEDMGKAEKNMLKLENIVCELLRRKEYAEFLIGREGDFDTAAASAIKSAIAKTDYGNASLILVMPYMKAEIEKNRNDYLKYYNEIIICEESANTHYKSAITVRNKYMVDRSELVIGCIERQSGGAYRAVEYARKNGIDIVNIAEECTEKL